MHVRLSVVFEGHCFSPLKSSLAVLVCGLIWRQVFGYLEDIDEKMKKRFSDILNWLHCMYKYALPAVLLLLAVAF